MGDTFMRVLGIGAHPDDLEIGCGGTLAKYKKAGHYVALAAVTWGEKGHFDLSPEELAGIRAAESKKAGAIIDAEVFDLGLKDGEVIAESLENRLIVIDIIRQTSPDIIITHPPQDYHPDHMAVNKLVLNATFLATVPHFKTEHPAVENVPQVYFMETFMGVDFLPQIYVDISKTLDMKIRMLEAHQSQLKWLKEHDAIDIIEYVRTSARFRGFQCGTTHAEGFIKHFNYPRDKASNMFGGEINADSIEN
ncbi:MAG: PIG-L family deacetylase [Bacillota bacterium]